MDFSELFVSLNNRKARPFLAFSFSLLAVGVATELVYATSGRFSAVGNSVPQLIPLGILLYGLLEHFFPAFCRSYRRLIPVLLLVYSVVLLVVDKAPFMLPLSALFGVMIGLFICASLVSFLESGQIQNRGPKIGIAISLYSIAAYLLNRGYYYFPKAPVTMIGLLILAALLLVVFYLWPEDNSVGEASEKASSLVLSPRKVALLLAGLIVLIALGQVMNSGTLEAQGGIAGIPWLYVLIIVLRIPFAALLGYLIDKRLSMLYLAAPIALVAVGCFLPLFLYGATAGDKMAYLLLNLGVKGCVFLVCILCMTAALRRCNKGFVAGLGMLVYFASEGYLNLHVLGLSLTSFEGKVEFPLTLTIILLAFLTCLYLLYLTTQMYTAAPIPEGQFDRDEIEKAMREKYHFTKRESEVAYLLLEDKSVDEIADILFIKKASVQNNIHRLISKTGAQGRPAMLAQIRRIKF